MVHALKEGGVSSARLQPLPLSINLPLCFQSPWSCSHFASLASHPGGTMVSMFLGGGNYWIVRRNSPYFYSKCSQSGGFLKQVCWIPVQWIRLCSDWLQQSWSNLFYMCEQKMTELVLLPSGWKIHSQYLWVKADERAHQKLYQSSEEWFLILFYCITEFQSLKVNTLVGQRKERKANVQCNL